MSTPTPLEAAGAPGPVDWIAAERPHVPPPHDGASILHAMIRTIALAPATGDALQGLFGVLRDGCGAVAVALETSRESMTRLQPYGDVSAVMSTSAVPRSDVEVLSAPLEHVDAPIGRLLAALPAEGRLSQLGAQASPGDARSEARILLDSAALLISQRLGQEMLARRAEEADLRAEHRISEVAAIYEIGQAIDQIEHPRLLQLITERAASLMSAQACSLMVVDEDTDSLHVAASTGLRTRRRCRGSG